MPIARIKYRRFYW